jgi:hypothetical protein
LGARFLPRGRHSENTQRKAQLMGTFIALKAIDKDDMVSVNTDHIVRVDDLANADRTVIRLSNGDSIPVEGKERARLWDILSQSTLLPADESLL